MTPEEKLQHLKIWMYKWIDRNAEKITGRNNNIESFYKTGILPFTIHSFLDILPFDEYLKFNFK